MEDRIAKLAYSKWEAAGCPHGYDKQHWLEAEAELSAEGCTEDHYHTAECGGKRSKVAAAAPAKMAAKSSKGSR